MGRVLFPTLLGLCLACPPAAPAETAVPAVNERQVARWNQFAHGLVALLRDLAAAHATRREERVGGYSRRPAYYREVTYRHAPGDRLLGRVRWERETGLLHSVEVYEYDDAGRLARDYGAAFLVEARNAPIQTYLTLHAYPDGLHSAREFDASGTRTFEHCKGRLDGEEVDFRLPYEELAGVGEPSPLFASAAYRACFAPLPLTPGRHLNRVLEASSP